ncbi:hypothetical protein [Aurantibacter sp.]|uniref:hypothetical protein n=1 Tax=Aurantibacter sp. TaxID=2807103 RepID=UPI0035C8539A
MKKTKQCHKKVNCILFFMMLLTLSITYGQAPEKMVYQTIVKNTYGEPISNQSVNLRMTIQQMIPGGLSVYTETYTKTTDNFGLIKLDIGTGTSVDDFSAIDWSSGPFYLETAIDVTGGTSYNVIGAELLTSVPYALYAKTAGTDGPQGPEGPIGAIGLDGQNGSVVGGPEISVTGTGLTTDPFEVSLKQYTIGYWEELGGYVFHLSPDGRHGTVIETIDQGIAPANGHTSILSDPQYHSTAGQNFFDWRLPSVDELALVFQYFSNDVTGFSDTLYYLTNTKDTNISGGILWQNHVINTGRAILIYGSSVSAKIRSVRSF